MRIVCISDTHNCYPDLPDGDMLIHAGDATVMGSIPEIEEFGEWFNSQPFKHKIFVAGNHDWLYETAPSRANKIVQSLHDNSVEIEGLKIYGTSWNPRYHDWAFNVSRGPQMWEKLKDIPTDIDILVTHSPPYGIRDSTPRTYSLGCLDLFTKMKEMTQLKLHVFGHIHSGYGMEERDGVIYVNAANCDESYIISNDPIVVDI